MEKFEIITYFQLEIKFNIVSAVNIIVNTKFVSVLNKAVWHGVVRKSSLHWNLDFT